MGVGVSRIEEGRDEMQITRFRAVRIGDHYKGRGYSQSYSGLTVVEQLTLETPERFATRDEALAAVRALADFHGFDSSSATVSR